jgi:hypothetical protein
MEVHAHTHTERKKWFHYLWEFLMLFLAVFCGFLAEYLLEHKIERERGHQYISSFYEDLKTDTSKFTILINSYQEKLLALEERDECFKTISQDIKSDSCLANLFLNSIQFSDLIFTDRTIQQLKNAGGLRLLKKEDADSIMEYDNMLQLHMRRETTGFQNLQNTVRNAIQSLMNYNFYLEAKSNVQVLYESDRKMINNYFVLLEWYAHYSKLNMESIMQIKLKATGLLEYFKKKYHLN